MASTYSLVLLFLVLFFQSSVISAQHYTQYSYREPCRRSDFLPSAKNDTKTTVVEVEKIAKALRESGYEAMPMVLENHLRSISPYYCESDDFLFFVDRRSNKLTIHGDGAVTLFVPRDEAVRLEEWVDLEYQIVASKVDEEAFESASLFEGSKLVSCSARKQRLVVDRVFGNGTVCINNVKINKWNIYNDGRVIVHGTEDFFNHFLGMYNNSFAWCIRKIVIFFYILEK